MSQSLTTHTVDIDVCRYIYQTTLLRSFSPKAQKATPQQYSQHTDLTAHACLNLGLQIPTWSQSAARLPHILSSFHTKTPSAPPPAGHLLLYNVSRHGCLSLPGVPTVTTTTPTRDGQSYEPKTPCCRTTGTQPAAMERYEIVSPSSPWRPPSDHKLSHLPSAEYLGTAVSHVDRRLFTQRTHKVWGDS